MVETMQIPCHLCAVPGPAYWKTLLLLRFSDAQRHGLCPRRATRSQSFGSLYRVLEKITGSAALHSGRPREITLARILHLSTTLRHAHRADPEAAAFTSKRKHDKESYHEYLRTDCNKLTMRGGNRLSENC